MEEVARAKINLALHVRGRDADGYHRLETVFAFAEQGDLLQVDDGAAPRATQGAADLATLIERHALDVETIGSVHGRNATVADLRAALPASGAARR